MFFLQSRRKEQEVQRQLVWILNNHCSEVQNMVEGPRLEGRVNLTMPVQVVPWTYRRPSCELAFAATTRELSTSGMSIIVPQPVSCETVAVGWTVQGVMHFAKGKFRHQDPLGAGFWFVGVQLFEMVCLSDWPELSELRI